MAMGHLAAARLPGGGLSVRTLGLGRLADLSSADASPDDAQRWDTCANERSLAMFQVLARFPEGVGQMKFLRDRLFKSRTAIIEYK